jgi:hypothetical protein
MNISKFLSSWKGMCGSFSGLFLWGYVIKFSLPKVIVKPGKRGVDSGIPIKPS